MRAYPPEFKAQLIAESQQPGASVAKVALAHGVNANMLHTWRREVRGSVPTAATVRPEFVPLPLNAPAPIAATAPIRIELRRGATSVAVSWPTEAAGACAVWLRELLR